LDDILIFSESPEEHVKHLQIVFDILRKHKFFCRLKKCVFNKSELHYLGHIVGKDGLKVDPRKISIIQDWPLPVDVPQLRSFLGLANYFRKFIQGYSSMVSPLTSLQASANQSAPFQDAWQPIHQNSFQAVKDVLTSAPLLRLPDFNKAFELIADASLNGVGAVLFQEGHPIAYYSKKFTPAERNYTTGEQELLAIHSALVEWRCYLEGPDITLVTDHNPLTYLKTQPLLSRKQARWLEFFSRFHYTWQYRPGRQNVADPISRCPILFNAVLADGHTLPSAPSISQEIIAAYIADEFFNDPKNTSKFTLEPSGFWIKPSTTGSPAQIVVPNSTSIKLRIMSQHHDTPLAGHIGRDRTFEIINRTFWWPAMRRDIDQFVASCDSCQRNKSRNGKIPGLLQPLPIPESPWQVVTMDFVTGLLPTKRKFDSIATFVDKCTGMVHLAATKTTLTASDAAQLFFEHVVQYHGEPERVISDRGTQFSGKFFQEYVRILGTQSRMSTSYHPQSDGQTERMNRVVEDMLRSFVSNTPDDWDKLLPAAAFAINNAFNSSRGNTPFFLNYGRHPQTPFTRDIAAYRPISVPDAETSALALQNALRSANKSMEAAQQRQKSYFDRHKIPSTFQPGDLVMLSAKNLRRGKGSKLLPKWIGPYPVTKMVGPSAVNLQLPVELQRIHNTFHVSLVKMYTSRTHGNLRASADNKGDPQACPRPITLDYDGTPIFEISEILRHRDRKIGKGRNRKSIREYLVSWTEMDSCNDSWIPVSDMSNQQMILDYHAALHA
jgi:transposase InsO family protein